MKRKVIKVGTSAAVIIPKESLQEERVRIGDTISVSFSKKEPLIQKGDDVDPRVIQYAEDCMEEYKDLLKKLADS